MIRYVVKCKNKNFTEEFWFEILENAKNFANKMNDLNLQVFEVFDSNNNWIYTSHLTFNFN